MSENLREIFDSHCRDLV